MLEVERSIVGAITERVTAEWPTAVVVHKPADGAQARYLQSASDYCGAPDTPNTFAVEIDLESRGGSSVEVRIEMKIPHIATASVKGGPSIEGRVDTARSLDQFAQRVLDLAKEQFS